MPRGRWGNKGTAASVGHYGGMVTGGKHIYSQEELSQNSFVHHKSHTQFVVATPVTMPELEHGLRIILKRVGGWELGLLVSAQGLCRQ
jgi:hypothetical protein